MGTSASSSIQGRACRLRLASGARNDPGPEQITLIATLAVLVGVLVIQLVRHSSVWFVTAAVMVVVVVVRIVVPAIQQRQGRDK